MSRAPSSSSPTQRLTPMPGTSQRSCERSTASGARGSFMRVFLSGARMIAEVSGQVNAEALHSAFEWRAHSSRAHILVFPNLLARIGRCGLQCSPVTDGHIFRLISGDLGYNT